MEAMIGDLSRRECHGVLVGHPAGVHAVHVNAVLLIVGGRSARKHVECCLRHVGVRMPRRFVVAVELPLHRRHVHDVLVTVDRAHHERLEARVDDERRNGVHKLHFKELHAGYLGQQESPRIPVTQVHLLQILIELALRKEAVPSDHRIPIAHDRRDTRFRRIRQHVVAAQSLPAPEHSAHVSRQRLHWRHLAGHHVRVKLRRPTHGLAGVVDDEIEPIVRSEQLATERLHAWGVPQVQPEQLESIAPLRKIGLGGIAGG